MGEPIVAVVKRDCPTCALIEPVLADLVERGVVATVHREDDDAGLEASWRLGIETVPTLVRGDERIVGRASLEISRGALIQPGRAQ